MQKKNQFYITLIGQREQFLEDPVNWFALDRIILAARRKSCQDISHQLLKDKNNKFNNQAQLNFSCPWGKK